MSYINARILDTAQETLDQFQSQLEPLLQHFHHDHFDEEINHEDAFTTLEDYFYACIEAYRMTHSSEYLKRAEVLTKPLHCLAHDEKELSDLLRFNHLVNNFTILSHHHFESAQGVTTTHKSTQYIQYEFPPPQQIFQALKQLDTLILTHGEVWHCLDNLVHYFYASIENFQHSQNEALLHERLLPFSKNLYKCYLAAIGDRLHHRHFDQIPVPDECELLLGRLWRDYHYVRDHNYDAINQLLCPPPPKHTS